jgi:hypothetical protein
MQELVKATLAARDRLNDHSIATRVKAGLFQIVRVTYGKRGVSTVTEVSARLPLPQIIEALNAM